MRNSPLRVRMQRTVGFRSQTGARQHTFVDMSNHDSVGVLLAANRVGIPPEVTLCLYHIVALRRHITLTLHSHVFWQAEERCWPYRYRFNGFPPNA